MNRTYRNAWTEWLQDRKVKLWSSSIGTL